MNSFLRLSMLFMLSAAVPQSILPRITGGDNVQIQKIPYQAALLYYNSIYCGAVILSEKYAATSAFCTYGKRAYDFTVRAGSNNHDQGGYVLPLEDIITHPQFNFDSGKNDISLLKLALPFVFSKSIQPVPIAKSAYNAGAMGVVSGWGHEYPGPNLAANLKAVTVPLVEQTDCQQYFNNRLTETNICAGATGKDACSTDDGGPFVVNGELVGIVSRQTNCHMEVFLSIYTDITSVKDFIEGQLTQ